MKNLPRYKPLRQTEALLQKMGQNESNLLHQRNPVRPLEHNYNCINTTVIDPEIYRSNVNRVGQGPKLILSDRYEHINPRTVLNLTSPGVDTSFDTEHDPYPIVHHENYRMHRLRTFNDESKELPRVPHGRLLSELDYHSRGRRNNGSVDNEVSSFANIDESKVFRENLFLTSHKKDIHINTDIDSNDYVTTTGLVSKDAPEWFQKTHKYHVREFKNEMRRTKQGFEKQAIPDVLLNPFPVRTKTPHIFRMSSPYKGQRFKKNVIALIDRNRTKSVAYNDQFTSQGLEWKEKPEKQSYDHHRLTNKIPVKEKKIQDLITKENFGKIGENMTGQKVNSMRPIYVKIGHPDRIYEVRKKYE